jgi:hypothetical protein
MVTFPALAATREEDRAAAEAQPIPQRVARVLLVEDNADTAESLTKRSGRAFATAAARASET